MTFDQWESLVQLDILDGRYLRGMCYRGVCV